MSLYLKYRPKTIDELDLAGVRKTLSDMVAGNALAHAYLFTGPRGAGKTSAARILARVITCEKNATTLAEPCNTCDACQSILAGSAVDVIEIDAASNRGIDDIRELKERIRLAPAILRKKVYIIDEVHMLTTEAFNALLKTLEEPPDHAVFILCTTESHKVPETISSRCVRVTFTKATAEEMTRSFTRVIAGEKAKMDNEAIEFLSQSVDGSFRDGVKILDTVLSQGTTVSRADVEKVLFGASGFKSTELSAALARRDTSEALTFFRQALSEGVDIVHILISFMKDIRGGLLSLYGVGETPLTGVDVSLTRLVVMLDDVARKIATSPVPAYLVEMVIIEWCGGSDNRSTQKVPPSPKATDGRSSKSPESDKSDKSPEQEIQLDNVVVPTMPEETHVTSEEMVGVDATEAWNKLITNLQGASYSLGALLSKAHPGMIQGNTLMIEMEHEFHKEQLMQAKFRTQVEKLVSDVVGRAMRIECTIVTRHSPLQSDSQVDTIAQVAPENNELVDAAVEIFSAQG